jgi:hypothetical protein
VNDQSNKELVSEPGDVDPRTGVRRLNLWAYDCEGSDSYGDNARGYAYESSYVSDDGYGAAEVAVFPTCEEWGWDVCEMTTAGEAVREGDVVRPSDSADVTYDYPHALVIDSLEEAQRIAERIGSTDYSYALNLRKIERGI